MNRGLFIHNDFHHYLFVQVCVCTRARAYTRAYVFSAWSEFIGPDPSEYINLCIYMNSGLPLERGQLTKDSTLKTDYPVSQ